VLEYIKYSGDCFQVDRKSRKEEREAFYLRLTATYDQNQKSEESDKFLFIFCHPKFTRGRHIYFVNYDQSGFVC
jgi:hypothetical protein